MSKATLALRHGNKRRKLGRRGILDAKLTKTICGLLSQGNSIKTTMELLGLGESTFHDWVQRGEQGEKNYVEFVRRTTCARGKAKQRLVKTIVRQAPDDWKAAAWLLSHCWPQEFSELVRNEVGMLAGIVYLPQKAQGPE